MTIKNSSDLEDWIDRQPFEVGAAVSLRVALRGIYPIFASMRMFYDNINSIRALNAAIVHLVFSEHSERLTPVLQKFINHNRAVDAETAIERLKHYEAASARRRSRASSLDESNFAEGVLQKASDETAEKFRNAQAKAVSSVAAAMGTLSADAMVNQRRLLAAIGLVNRVQPTHRRLALWRAIRIDCEVAEKTLRPAAVFEQPLWDEFMSPHRDQPDAEIARFWVYWYRGFDTGRPLNWQLLAEVALAEGEDDANVNAVLAKKILELELNHLRRLACQPERVVIDQQTGLYKIEADRINDPLRYQNAIRKVSDDIEEIEIRVSEIGSNSYEGLKDINRFVKSSIAANHAEPMFIHDDFVKAIRMITRRIERDEIPAYDDWIENLIEDLNTATIDIRAIDVGVAKAVDARARIKARKPNEEEERSLVLQIEIRSKQSDERLAKQLLDDCRSLVEFSPNSDFAPEQAAQRMANRLPQMQRDRMASPDGRQLEQVAETSGYASRLNESTQPAEHRYSWLQYLLSMF